MNDIAFLSIIDWRPKDGVYLKDVLAAAAGMTERDAALALRKGMPVVVAAMPHSEAVQIGETLRSSGATAFAPTLSQMTSVGEAQLLKQFDHAAGSPWYMATPWRGDQFGINAADIRLIVRAAPRSKTKVTHTLRNAVHTTQGTIYTATEVTRDRSDKMDILDIETNAGLRVRIDSRKFSFPTVKGAGYVSEGVRMDELAADLAEQSPQAIVDLGFPDFGVGEHLVRRFWKRGATQLGRQSATPTFDFYSTWASLLYRVLAGG